MRHRDLALINQRYIGSAMRRLSLHFAPEGEGVEGGQGAGSGAGGGAAKTYTEAEVEQLVGGLKAKNAELLGKTKTLSERAKVIGDRTPEEVQADLEYAAEQRKLDAEKKGRYDDIVKQITEKHGKEKADLTATLTAREVEIQQLVGEQAAVKAIADAGGKVKKLLDPIMKHVKVVRGDDGKAVAVVVDAKGNPRVADASGALMTIPQLVETFRADPDYGNDFAASGASGSGARNESGGRGGSATVVIPKNASPQEYRRLKEDAVKRGVPYVIGG